MKHNKLVRDRIPAIIAASGRTAHTRLLTEEEYIAALHRKLDEEAAELHADPCLEEMADLLEVMHGILHHRGIPWEELEKVRLLKRDARGGFEQGIFLIMPEK